MTNKRTTTKHRKPDVVGMHEIAARLDVPLYTVKVWRSRGVLPAEDYMLARTPAWLWETIEQWRKIPRPSGGPGHKPKVQAG